MDNFKENAEIKMREAVEKQVQGEIDTDEEEYRTRQEEFRELQNLDTKEKRQMWMQSILVKTDSNQWPCPIQLHWVLEQPHLGPLVVVLKGGILGVDYSRGTYRQHWIIRHESANHWFRLH